MKHQLFIWKFLNLPIKRILPKFLLVFILFAFVNCLNAQVTKQIDLNSNTVFRDQNGDRISFNTFIEWTSGRGYKLNPIFDENDKLVEVFVLEPAVQSTTDRYGQFTKTPELIGNPAPDFDVYDLNNNYHSLSNMQGKVVVLKFWFAACRPCIDEMPQLNSLVNKYKNNSQVVFLGPSLDKPSRVNSFLSRQAFNYNIIPDSKELANLFKVPGYPTHVVINREGRVEAVFQGVNRRIEQRLTGAIERALRGSTRTTAARTTTSPQSLAVAQDLPEREVKITPQSLIKNEKGDVVPFGQFVELMKEKRFELINRREMDGSTYVLMKTVR